MPSPERPAVRAWRSFIRAKAEVSRAVHRAARERGLTGAQFAILRVLSDAGSEGMKLNEISQQLCVTSGNVTGLIDRLEEAGHLVRIPHPEDRRITLGVLTPAGREIFEQVYPSHVARITDVMSVLSAEEQVSLADLLTRVADRAAEMDR
jgi:MarR family 2-MHQ and catechol resistance regulon transcriptional repressor